MIRQYTKKDYYTVLSWWIATGEHGPTEDMLPEESTFILEKNGKPWICITLYLTNTKEFAMIDNLAADPKDKEGRKEAVQMLVDHVEKFAKEHGYKRLFCMAMHSKLAKRYQGMGYSPTGSGIFTFSKEVV